MNNGFVWRKIQDLKIRKRMFGVRCSLSQFFLKKVTRFEVLKTLNQGRSVGSLSVSIAFFTFYMACCKLPHTAVA
jgi:hypothetical protein